MADDIPANWYPDAHGTIRWWDGTQWTNYVRGQGASPSAPVEPEPAAQTPIESEPGAQTPVEPQPAAAGEPGRHMTVEADRETAVLSAVGSTGTAVAPASPIAPASAATTAPASPVASAAPPTTSSPLATAAPASAETTVSRPSVTYPRTTPSAPSTVTSRVIYPVNPEA
ncbi:MAG TPA: DUF2510 domain-containing protein, partial [Aeromicrobium sp.]|nr:DUF2510 domain-containing protein [Aeromicrobium sp.]